MLFFPLRTSQSRRSNHACFCAFRGLHPYFPMLPSHMHGLSGTPRMRLQTSAAFFPPLKTTGMDPEAGGLFLNMSWDNYRMVHGFLKQRSIPRESTCEIPFEAQLWINPSSKQSCSQRCFFFFFFTDNFMGFVESTSLISCKTPALL